MYDNCTGYSDFHLDSRGKESYQARPLKPTSVDEIPDVPPHLNPLPQWGKGNNNWKLGEEGQGEGALQTNDVS
jgi:hypothetical protein